MDSSILCDELAEWCRRNGVSSSAVDEGGVALLFSRCQCPMCGAMLVDDIPSSVDECSDTAAFLALIDQGMSVHVAEAHPEMAAQYPPQHRPETSTSKLFNASPVGVLFLITAAGLLPDPATIKDLIQKNQAAGDSKELIIVLVAYSQADFKKCVVQGKEKLSWRKTMNTLFETGCDLRDQGHYPLMMWISDKEIASARQFVHEQDVQLDPDLETVLKGKLITTCMSYLSCPNDELVATCPFHSYRVAQSATAVRREDWRNLMQVDLDAACRMGDGGGFPFPLGVWLGEDEMPPVSALFDEGIREQRMGQADLIKKRLFERILNEFGFPLPVTKDSDSSDDEEDDGASFWSDGLDDEWDAQDWDEDDPV